MIYFRRRHPSTGVATIFSDFSSELSEEKFPQRYHERFNNVPASNIYETANEYNIELAVPGKAKEEFTIEIENHVLHVSCVKDTEKEKNLQKAYTRQEYDFDNFCRSFNLPENVNDTGITAKYKNGMLHVIIPKKEEPVKVKKTIEITS